MSNISTLLYQFLKTKFGDLDWENGSVLRELVASPVVALSERATEAINAAYNALNISALLADPETNSESIDALFDYLGLTAPNPGVSEGSVRLLMTSDETFVLPIGASFSYGNTILTTNTQLTVGVDLQRTDSTLPLTRIGYNTYEVIVPVIGPLTGGSLSEGTELSWNVANESIYSATVYSTIAGSGSEYTATQKINQIRQYLFPASLSCAEGFLKTINNYAEGLAVDCQLSARYPVGGIDLYVKTVQPPEIWRVTVTGDQAESGYAANIDAVGVIKVRTVVGGTLTGVERSGRNIIVSWTGSSATVEVELSGLRGLSTAQEAIDQYTENTGIQVNVKAPRLLFLSMYLPTNASVLSTKATNKVVNAVNNSLLNAAGLGDHTTIPILEAAGVSLQGAGTYTLEDLLSGSQQTSVATINTTPFMSAMEPVAIYTTSDKITTADNGQAL